METTYIFPLARGFFIVKFETIEDRNSIFSYNFSWDEKFPLMAKTWHKDFNPLTKSFNKFPLWVRLLNLPLHLWEGFVLKELRKALGDFVVVDTAWSNVF